MNRNQWIAITAFAANLVLILLFPPVDEYSVASNVAIFGGFRFFLDVGRYAEVNTSLFTLEAFVVLINAGIAWELLRDRRPSRRRRFNPQNAVLLFTGANLVLVLLFPPFESVFALTKAAIPSFEGFYFLFDRRPAHVIVTTLLYLEVFFILANGALFWLLFREKAAELTAEEAYMRAQTRRN